MGSFIVSWQRPYGGQMNRKTDSERHRNTAVDMFAGNMKFVGSNFESIPSPLLIAAPLDESAVVSVRFATHFD